MINLHPLLSNCYTCILIYRYAKDILQKEMLPHVDVEEHRETKKAYYFGYVCYKSDLVTFTLSIYYAYHSPTDISFTGYCCVHLGGVPKMIGIITETRGWTWQVLYLVVSLEGFVSQIIDMILLYWSCYLVFFISNSWFL
jgi:hypothetical protein